MIAKLLTIVRTALVLFVVAAGCTPPTEPARPVAPAVRAGVESVVFIGIDALSPDGIRNSDTPHLVRLMQGGAHTLQARAVMPTVSSPNWASMIMGAGPEQHGVTSNEWKTDEFELSPTDVGPGGMFPTIFSVLREQRPDLVMGCFHDWPGFGRLFEKDALDHVFVPDLPRETSEDRVRWAEDTIEKAISFLEERRPDFVFIQLDHVDHFGHRYGHGSAEYYRSVEHADGLIGRVVERLEELGILESSIVMISSDHGGVGTGHGGATDAEVLIPWIMAGPGVVAGRELGPLVNTYDTAATIAHIFGVVPPESWIARPILHAFE